MSIEFWGILRNEMRKIIKNFLLYRLDNSLHPLSSPLLMETGLERAVVTKPQDTGSSFKK